MPPSLSCTDQGRFDGLFIFGTRRKPDANSVDYPLGVTGRFGPEQRLIGRPLHQHKLHLSDMYGLRRNHPSSIFLKDNGFVFHKGK